MLNETNEPLVINQAAKYALRADFRFRDIEEAHIIASFLASACPNPRLAVIGIIELLMNAIEHGNLGISYEEKSSLQKQGIWTEEVEKRLKLPENCNKYVDVTFERVLLDNTKELHITVKDQGEGFDWKNFEGLNQEKTLQHGRGLTIARSVVFTRLDFIGHGNEVIGVISLE